MNQMNQISQNSENTVNQMNQMNQVLHQHIFCLKVFKVLNKLLSCARIPKAYRTKPQWKPKWKPKRKPK